MPSLASSAMGVTHPRTLYRVNVGSYVSLQLTPLAERKAPVDPVTLPWMPAEEVVRDTITSAKARPTVAGQ